MVYRYDPDLEFLKTCSDKELNDLVHCLTYDKDGEIRWMEELTIREGYKRFYPKHNMYWEEVAGEIQCVGAYAFASVYQGGPGMLYKELLGDVCNKLNVNYNKNSSTEQIENALLLSQFSDSLETMPASKVKELMQSTGIKEAYQVVVSAVVQVAYLRSKKIN